jgi:hypothetical protein
MSLADKARLELALLRLNPHGLQVWEIAEGGQRFSCELTQVDTLACAFTRSELICDALAGAGLDKLRQVSETLSKRLTYLLEPVKPIEVDADRCVVQMRSSPPQQSDNATTYYELLVERGGKLSLSRYQKPPGKPREVLPAHVTREVLLRLIGDFSAAAA